MKRLRRDSVTRFTKRWLLSGIVVMGVSWPVLAHADEGPLPAPQQTPQATTPKQVATQPKAPTIAGHEVYENGHWYLKDAQNQSLSAWQNLSDQRLAYYHPTTKQMQYGEQNVAGQWYFLDQQNGDVKTGWYKLPDGRQVYYDVTKGDHQVSGRGMLHGQQDVGQATYYFDDWNGAQVTGLKQVQGKTYYYAPAMVKNREAYANGHWRYFGADGTMQTGFVQLKDGRTVYYNGAGEMRYGEQAINHRWYYFDPVNGAMKRGWFTLPDKRKVYYDLQANGQGRGMLHGQQDVGQATYYFDDWNGAQVTGLKQVQGKTYYYAPAMVKNGEAYANGHWRYFGADGMMQTGFVQLKDGRTVYYNGAGEMQYGEQAINHQWYYFNPQSGEMARGWFNLPDRRKVYYDLQANGQGRGMLHGQQQLGDQIYYFNDWNGALHTNYAHYLAKVGKLQYYGSDGKLARRQTVRAEGQYQADELGYLALKLGENLVGTNWYLVSAAGRLLTGWQVIAGNRTVYYDPATAAMVKGERYLAGHWYYFNPVDGHRSTGLTQLPDGRYVYYAANGQMQYGRVQAGRITYFTNRASGAIEGVYNDAEVIGQNPELPTGCEITAVTMMLRYAGKDVNKIQLAREMPRSNDGNKGFVGDPFSVTGWWIFPTGVAPVVNHHLGHSEVMTGASLAAIKTKLILGHLVVAWVANVNGFVNHAIALTGYQNDRLYFNNPWTARKESMSVAEFYQHWNQDAQRALSY
ncbi:C39 family peptidase [Limosilactobacillus ingluviei]|uniref:C39 family peptidase n=1 Tax=Limosilactobacillus ingluviei TaxID=148604 RepID=UPI0002F9D426|nr:C39 family peptidase [Limosilactobacillus ingluviei]